jgi:receptor protein-tyrosine kinase
VANAFADATIAVRKRDLARAITPKVQTLRTQLAQIPNTPANQQLRSATAEQLVALTAIQNEPDPSVLLSARAEPSSGPSSPGLKTILAAGLFVGLLWGVGAAFVCDALLSKVRSDRQLRENFNVPILARVPVTRGARAGATALAPEELSQASAEAYRTLRQNVGVLRGDQDRVRTLVFTSASPAEGKTTSAINTAAALARGGQRVILVDADLRHPSIGATLSIAPAKGVTSVLSGTASLDEALVSTSRYGGRLDLLLVSPGDPQRVEVLTRPAVERLIADAAERADFLVFDTSPLGTVADALPIVTAAEDVFVTVRRGHTTVSALERLTELLARHTAMPRGFVFIGGDPEKVKYGAYYYEAAQEPTEKTGKPGR